MLNEIRKLPQIIILYLDFGCENTQMSQIIELFEYGVMLLENTIL